ncbi:hypothetical protein CesoFtcFv8_004861 [Champsocephalus esox]|uniref:Uncharacterized protein n=1 Tax=Champsocephalus esox TaxID=159716 RepID=A0AAN8CML7_9TELE|nr:hypothetical protein CesoFtcFv8_004861 [Champsocephalus esox]
MAKETSRSRYEGKHFPQAARTKSQLLPVFPEMLDEVSVSWRDRPFSKKVQIQGVSYLDCDGMEKLGLFRIPPMEPLVAAHLLPRVGPSPSRNPTLPAKLDRFQSTMTERSYKAAALSARALNVSSLLTAYQAELCEDLSGNPGAAILDESSGHKYLSLCPTLRRPGHGQGNGDHGGTGKSEMAQPHQPPRPGKGGCAGYAHRSQGNFRLRSRLHAKEV